MPIVEGMCKQNVGQDGNRLLTSAEIQVAHGVGEQLLATFREEGCPKKKCGKEWRYPAAYFAMWLEQKSLEGVDAIGCLEVVLDSKGKVLGFIDLTRRWIAATLLLVLCSSGCASVPSVEEGRDRVHRTIECGISAKVDEFNQLGGMVSPSVEASLKAVWEVQ